MVTVPKLANVAPWAVSAALAGILALAWHDEKAAIAKQAVTQALLAQSDSAYTAAAHRADSASRQLTTDTLIIHHETVRYQAVHDTVLTHLTDTVVVKEFVQAADSTIHACTRALHDCASLTAALRGELAADDGKIAALQRITPTFVQRHDGALAVLTAVAGFYLGTRVK